MSKEEDTRKQIELVGPANYVMRNDGAINVDLPVYEISHGNTTLECTNSPGRARDAYNNNRNCTLSVRIGERIYPLLEKSTRYPFNPRGKESRPETEERILDPKRFTGWNSLKNSTLRAAKEIEKST